MKRSRLAHERAGYSTAKSTGLPRNSETKSTGGRATAKQINADQADRTDQSDIFQQLRLPPHYSPIRTNAVRSDSLFGNCNCPCQASKACPGQFK
jgi:hypothetical protein